MRRQRRLLGLVPVALLPPAAFAVHQLRYFLAYGSAAGHRAPATGPLVPAFDRPLDRRPDRTGRRPVPARARARVRRPVLGPALRRLVPRTVAVVRRCARRDLHRAGVPGGVVRDRPSGGTGRRVRFWRLVGDPRRSGYRTRARRRVPRRNLGPARGGSPLRLPPRPRAHRRPVRARQAQVFVPRLAPLVGGWSGRGPPV